jgi:transposase-like protein
MFPQSRSGDLVRMARSQKKKQILHCELCGKPLHPEEGEPIEHGKMKICKACYIDLNWFKPKCVRRRVRTEVVF